jgi:translation initiation factor 3 subunit L
MLGYFSLIGLLRVHVLLGDFTLGLKVVEHVELNQKVCHRPILLIRAD